MNRVIVTLCSTFLVAQTANVQIVHNSPYPTVDIYVDGVVALEDVEYRASTGLLELPVNTTVGIAPADGDVIASFDFALEEGEDYIVVASGIVGDTDHPFELLASGLETEAEDDGMFALQVMHGVTDAPAVDIYANGILLVDSLAYGDFAGYLQVPADDYTLDITAHGEEDVVISFSAPLSGFGGGAAVVYASGFLAPTDQDSAFTLILTTPLGDVIVLEEDEVYSPTANVQIVHNSPYPTVDIYVDGVVALEDVEYRASTGLLELPVNTTVGIAPADGDVIASFDFALEEGEDYIVVASGIVGDTDHPFELLASGLETEAEDDGMFALQVMHGVTDAPAVDIYANGILLVDSLAYGDFAGYLQVPADDYTLDITAHGEEDVVISFSAPLSGFGGGAAVVYASGFLAPTDQDSAFTLILTTPLGDVIDLSTTTLAVSENGIINPSKFSLHQNYPNPFNPSTQISYNLPEDAMVNINIYDLIGHSVKTLVSSNQIAGYRSVRWDATNDEGQAVSAGMYIYIVQAGEQSQTKKMILLK